MYRRVMLTAILSTTMLAMSLAVGPLALGGEEQRMTLIMDEFSFKPAKVVLKAGVPVVLELVNNGKIEHEFMVYERPSKDTARAHLHDWAEDQSYFRRSGLQVKGTDAKLHRKGRDIVMVMVPAGGSATLTFTPRRVGTFEIGCLVPGHYEVGMKGTWVVEAGDM